MKTFGRGFTLLELIVVVALIGIMLVVSVPTLHNTLIDDRLKATSRKIIGLINGVRELAVREQQSYFLSIDRNENRIWYEKDSEIGSTGNTEDTEDTEDIEDTEDKLELNIPDEIRISEIWTRSEGEYSDDQSRIWVLSYTRQLKFEEMGLSIQYRDGDGRYEGNETIHTSENIEIDAFEFHIFDPEGRLLGTIPLIHHSGVVRIFRDRLYLLEPRHGMCVYCYRITSP